MEQEFWHEAWSKADQPGWQQNAVNPYLVKHWAASGALPGEAVFVPLCGRSLDMQWLRDYGHHIIGIDLSVSALQKFCEQQSIDATCERDGELTVFRAPGWTLYAGDFFKLQKSHIAPTCRVYDRAALIALPPRMRESYAAHLREILPGGSEILIITIDYDQQQMKGPPFSVSNAEVHTHFADAFDIVQLESASGPEQLGSLKKRGLDKLTETCSLLQPRRADDGGS